MSIACRMSGADDDGGLSLELEHAIGFDGARPGMVHFHPDGVHYIFAAGACIIVGNVSDLNDQTFMRGHDSELTCLALSSQGTFAASGSSGKNADVVVWDFASRQARFRLMEHDHEVTCIAFSPDEKLLITVGSAKDGKMFVWDISSGNIVAGLTAYPEVTVGVSWGGHERNIKHRSTGNYVFATCGNREVALWVLDPSTGKATVEKMHGAKTIRESSCLAFSSNAETLYAGSTSGDVSSYSVRGRTLQKQVSVAGSSILWMCVSSGVGTEGNGMLACGGSDGQLTLIELDDDFGMTVVTRMKFAGALSSVSSSPDFNTFLLGTSRGCIQLANPLENSADILLESHQGSVVSCAFLGTHNDMVFTCGIDGNTVAWDLNTFGIALRCVGIRQASLENLPRPSSLAVTDVSIITGFDDGSIRCHDLDSGEVVWQIKNAHDAGVTALSVANSQKFLVSGGAFGNVRVWDLKTRELIANIKEHGARVTSILMFDDDHHCLTCSRDKTFSIIDLRAEKRLSSHEQRNGGINDAVLCGDQVQVVTVGQERKLSFWDLREPQPLQIVEDIHLSEATCCALSSNGKLLATGGGDQIMRLWEFETGKMLAEGIGHSAKINRVKFSPDGKQVISVGSEGLILVWNVYA